MTDDMDALELTMEDNRSVRYPMYLVSLCGFLSPLCVIHSPIMTNAKERKYALLKRISNFSSFDISSFAAAAQLGISAKSNFKKNTLSFPVSAFNISIAFNAFSSDRPAIHTLPSFFNSACNQGTSKGQIPWWFRSRFQRSPL